MIEDQSSAWTMTKLYDGICRYERAPLAMEEAQRLQGKIIEALGKDFSNSGSGKGHKVFPCRMGVIGVENGQRQYGLSLQATPEQFSALFPNAVINAAPQPSLAV